MERLPAERTRGRLHVLEIFSGAERRHGVLALPRTLIHIARGIEDAAKVAGLPANADFEFDGVVVRLELVVADWPILDCRVLWKIARAVAVPGFGNGFEIPRLQAPALRVIVNRRAADGVHHGAGTAALRFLIGIGTECWRFAADLVSGGDHAANV